MATNNDRQKRARDTRSADDRAWPSIRWMDSAQRWQVDGRIGTDGKDGGRREVFRTREEADKRRQELREQLKRSGVEALEISTELRVEAISCSKRLAEKGATLTQATDHFLSYLAESAKSILWPAFYKEYLKTFYKWTTEGRVLSVRKPHYDDVRQRLGHFAEWAKDRLVSDITQQQIDEWLATLVVTKPGHPRLGLPLTDISTRKIKNLLVGAYGYALDKGYAKINPAKTNRRQQRDRKERSGLGTSSVEVHVTMAEILWPEEYAALLRAASEKIVPALVLQGLCGIRPSEAERIPWGHIDWDAGIIHIYPAVSKTHEYRAMPIRPVVAAFLEKYRGKVSGDANVTPRSYRDVLAKARKDARAALQKADAKHSLARWPSDCLRHGFASYYLAVELGSEQSLADEMGTSVGLIRSTYRQVTTRALGEKYWAITPACRA